MNADRSFLHIGIFGRHGVGKSSLIAVLTRPEGAPPESVATPDPVERPLELPLLGPVLLVDTAGIDDASAFGAQRVGHTTEVLDRTELASLVVGAEGLGSLEIALLDAFEGRKVPVLPVLGKADLAKPADATIDRLHGRGLRPVIVSAARGDGMAEVREALVDLAPDNYLNAPNLVADLVRPGELAVLVLPFDRNAPRERTVLPRPQVIRDITANHAHALVVDESDLRSALDHLKHQPALVVTDSLAFAKVAADTPPGVPMTSFSILFARQTGDLSQFVRGALAIDALKPGDRVAMAEACSHHPIGEDVGRIEIPRWLGQYVGGSLDVEQVLGRDFIDDPTDLKLVIHCGSCMLRRREMLSRIFACNRAGVPITNYGMAFAYSLGIFERALAPFPAVLATYRQALGARPDRAKAPTA